MRRLGVLALLFATTGVAAAEKTVPSLRAVSESRAAEIARRAAKIETSGGFLPWSWPRGNGCSDRACGVAFVAATGSSRIPAKLSGALVRKIERQPRDEVGIITLTGRIRGFVTYLLPNGSEIRERRESMYGDPDEMPRLDWYSHVAAVVNVRGKDGRERLRVIDPLVSDRPIPIATWTSTFLPKGKRALHLSDEEFNRAYLFNQDVLEETPRRTTGYRVRTAWNLDSVKPPPGGWTRYQVGALKYTASSDREALKSFLDAQGEQLSDAELEQVKVRFRPVGR